MPEVPSEHAIVWRGGNGRTIRNPADGFFYSIASYGECRVRFIASSMVAPESLAEGTSVNQTGIEAQAVLGKSTEKKLSATSMPLGGKMEIRRMKTLLIFSSTTARAFRPCRDA